MSKIYSYDFLVRHGETTRSALMRPDVFFEYMQEAAACNADDLGFGYKDLQNQHKIWVISRMKLQIHRTPKMEESIKLRTYPSGIRKLFALREFQFVSQTDEILAEASSWWLILDSERLRPLRPLEVFPDGFPEGKVFFEDLPKISDEPGGHEMTRHIYESMIDCNVHLNNAKTVGIACDWLAAQLGVPPDLKEIQINFTAATPPGSVLKISGEISGKDFRISARGGVPGEPELPRFEAAGVLK